MGLYSGHGTEPDRSYHRANARRLVGRSTIDLDAGDPPPGLWLEVDHRSSSKRRQAIYAAIGIEEIWRYRTRSNRLTFLVREGDHYVTADRSRSLPMLTSSLVLEALGMAEGLVESEWDALLREWAGRLPMREG